MPADDPRVKLCTVCGVITSRAGSRCTEHARQSDRSRHNALYGTRAWQRLSARVLRAWRGEHGNWCPGHERPLVAALARYVEALDRRYPGGPDQMRRERLAVAADSANVVVMNAKREDGAA